MPSLVGSEMCIRDRTEIDLDRAVFHDRVNAGIVAAMKISHGKDGLGIGWYLKIGNLRNGSSSCMHGIGYQTESAHRVTADTMEIDSHGPDTGGFVDNAVRTGTVDADTTTDFFVIIEEFSQTTQSAHAFFFHSAHKDKVTIRFNLSRIHRTQCA